MANLGRIYNIDDAEGESGDIYDAPRITAAEAFRGDMMENLGYAPKHVIGDGKVRRFPTSKRKNDDAGWYVLHDDEFPAGLYGDWRTGEKHNWRARETSEMSPIERERLEHVKVERAKAEEAERAEAIKKAGDRWNNAKPAKSDHPYLIKKGVHRHGVREESGCLLVPVHIDGKIASIQTIAADGSKMYQRGAPVAGGYFAIESDDDESGRFVVCEGFATGATIHEATGLSVLVAFTSGNLEAVAQMVRAGIRDATITIAADDDTGTEKERGFNPGITAVEKAAKAVGATVMVPPFDRERDVLHKGKLPTDFNDLCALHGADAVARAFGISSVSCDASASGESASHGGSIKSSGVNWPYPKPIRDELLPVPEFDPAFLPDSLANWVADVSDRMQCPPDFVGVPALVAMGSILGRKVAIRPQRMTDWTEVANLWGCIVGRPGMLKSPAMNEALKFLNKLESKARKENEEALEEYKREMRAYEAKEKAARSKKGGDGEEGAGDEPEKPRMRRYVLNDTTYESLGLAMAHNPEGVLAFRDELISLLKHLDDERNSSARGFYLTAWNGTSGYAFDRITREATYIDAACLSMLGATQPGRLSEYIRRSQGAGDDGMIQRFGLLVWPNQAAEWKHVDRYPDIDARNAAWATFERIDAATASGVGAEMDRFDGLHFLRFSDAAQELFDDWRKGLEARLRSGDLTPALESHLAKFRKLVPSLAITGHLADGGYGPVTEGAALRALAIAEYAEAHARRCYAAGSEAKTAGAKTILSHIRKGDLSEGFSLRDVMRKHWSGIGDTDRIDAALGLLEENGWIAPKIVRSVGRPTTVYSINPRAMS